MSATHSINLRLDIDINKVINEDNVESIMQIFNVGDDVQELLRLYGNLVIDELLATVKNRKEYVGSNATLSELNLAEHPSSNSVENKDDSADVVDDDDSEEDVSVDTEDNVFTLLEHLVKAREEIIYNKGEIKSLEIHNKFNLTPDDIELDVGIDSELCTVKDLDEYSYIIKSITEDKELKIKKIKL